MKFDHWEVSYDNGTNWTIVGYNKTYAFRMPTKDIKLQAVYINESAPSSAKGTAYIENVIIDKDGQKISFVAIMSVPEGATMKRAGIVACKESDFTDSNKVPSMEFARFRRYDETICVGSSTFKYTWTKGNVNDDDTWCVRAYLLYEDASGEHTIYSANMAKANLNGLV